MAFAVNIIKCRLRLRMAKLMPDTASRNQLILINMCIVMQPLTSSLYEERAKGRLLLFLEKTSLNHIMIERCNTTMEHVVKI